MNAAFGLAQLDKLDRYFSIRRTGNTRLRLYSVTIVDVRLNEIVFERYLEVLKDVPNIVLPKEPKFALHLFFFNHSSNLIDSLDSGKNNWLALPLMAKSRAKLLRHLENNGVQTRVCFAGNITR